MRSVCVCVMCGVCVSGVSGDTCMCVCYVCMHVGLAYQEM